MKRAAARAAAAIAVILLLAEIGLRLGGYAAPSWYELDPDLGWRLRPNRHGWFAGEEGRVAVNINPAGFRDRERFLHKPPILYRIAVLGDEYSEAMAVPVERSWWRQLGPALERCAPGRKVQVLNFAVGGYGTAQEYVLLQTTVLRYAPDLVLLQFSNRDDVMDNSFALTAQKWRPFYHADARRGLRIDASFVLSPEFERRMQTRYRLFAEIADHSRAFQLVRQAAGLAFVGEAQAVADPAALRPPRDPAWEEAWQVTDALIGAMNDHARRNGARFAVLAVPHPLQAAQGMAYPDQRLQSIGRLDSIPVITLAQGMRQPGLYLRSGEWSVEGHRRAADLTATQLCPLIATARPG